METELQLLFRSIHHALRRHENSQKNTAFRFLSHSKERSRHSNAKAVFLTHEINRIILKRMKKESKRENGAGRKEKRLVCVLGRGIECEKLRLEVHACTITILFEACMHY